LLLHTHLHTHSQTHTHTHTHTHTYTQEDADELVSASAEAGRAGARGLLEERGVAVVDWPAWKRIEAKEEV
jgi:hypothetical protein